jgi:DNA-binding transcriptional ArsR family regulator
MSRIAADASVFHAIADPTRRAILDLLREGERTVSQMMDALLRGTRRVTQSAFSQHLAVLRSAGLVAAEKKGRHRVYSFRAEPLTEVVDWIVAYDRFWTDKLDGLGRYLDARHPRSGRRALGSAQAQARTEA